MGIKLYPSIVLVLLVFVFPVSMDYNKNPIGVTAMDWSHDDTKVATGFADTSIKIKDKNGKHITDLKDQRDVISGLSWSSDDSYLASVSSDGSLNIWNMTDNSLYDEYSIDNVLLTSVDWHPSSDLIVTGGQTVITVVNSGSKKIDLEIPAHDDVITSVEWDPSGTKIVSSSVDGSTKIWNATSGDLIETVISGLTSIGDSQWMGSTDKIAYNTKTQLKFKNVSSNKVVKEINLDQEILKFDFNSNYSLLVITLAGNNFLVFDVEEDMTLFKHDLSYEYQVSNFNVSMIKWSHDSTILGMGGSHFFVIGLHNDSDMDNLTNFEELIIGTNIRLRDTDNDTMDDGWEVEHGLDPLNSSDGGDDNDEDGVVNSQEYNYDMDPNNNDSDGDGTADYVEIFGPPTTEETKRMPLNWFWGFIGSLFLIFSFRWRIINRGSK